MNLYEITIIIREDTNMEKTYKLLNIYDRYIVDSGGYVVKSEYWGLRSLSYHIKKNKKGHYIFYIIKADNSVLNEIRNTLRLKDEVLKFLFLLADNKDKILG